MPENEIQSTYLDLDLSHPPNLAATLDNMLDIFSPLFGILSVRAKLYPIVVDDEESEKEIKPFTFNTTQLGNLFKAKSELAQRMANVVRSCVTDVGDDSLMLPGFSEGVTRRTSKINWTFYQADAGNNFYKSSPRFVQLGNLLPTFRLRLIATSRRLQVGDINTVGLLYQPFDSSVRRTLLHSNCEGGFGSFVSTKEVMSRLILLKGDPEQKKIVFINGKRIRTVYSLITLEQNSYYEAFAASVLEKVEKAKTENNFVVSRNGMELDSGDIIPIITFIQAPTTTTLKTTWNTVEFYFRMLQEYSIQKSPKTLILTPRFTHLIWKKNEDIAIQFKQGLVTSQFSKVIAPFRKSEGQWILFVMYPSISKTAIIGSASKIDLKLMESLQRFLYPEINWSYMNNTWPPHKEDSHIDLITTEKQFSGLLMCVIANILTTSKNLKPSLVSENIIKDSFGQSLIGGKVPPLSNLKTELLRFWSTDLLKSFGSGLITNHSCVNFTPSIYTRSSYTFEQSNPDSLLPRTTNKIPSDSVNTTINKITQSVEKISLIRGLFRTEVILLNDLKLLFNETCLNDKVLDAYIGLLNQYCLFKRSDFFILSTQFFTRWTMERDILDSPNTNMSSSEFSKISPIIQSYLNVLDLTLHKKIVIPVFVPSPINPENVPGHFFFMLLDLTLKVPKLYIYDPLTRASAAVLDTLETDYQESVKKAKDIAFHVFKKNTIEEPIYNPKSVKEINFPQQPLQNKVDCGVLELVGINLLVTGWNVKLPDLMKPDGSFHEIENPLGLSFDVSGPDTFPKLRRILLRDIWNNCVTEFDYIQRLITTASQKKTRVARVKMDGPLLTPTKEPTQPSAPRTSPISNDYPSIFKPSISFSIKPTTTLSSTSEESPISEQPFTTSPSTAMVVLEAPIVISTSLSTPTPKSQTKTASFSITQPEKTMEEELEKKIQITEQAKDVASKTLERVEKANDTTVDDDIDIYFASSQETKNPVEKPAQRTPNVAEKLVIRSPSTTPLEQRSVVTTLEGVTKIQQDQLKDIEVAKKQESRSSDFSFGDNDSDFLAGADTDFLTVPGVVSDTAPVEYDDNSYLDQLLTMADQDDNEDSLLNEQQQSGRINFDIPVIATSTPVTNSKTTTSQQTNKFGPSEIGISPIAPPTTRGKRPVFQIQVGSSPRIGKSPARTIPQQPPITNTPGSPNRSLFGLSPGDGSTTTTVPYPRPRAVFHSNTRPIPEPSTTKLQGSPTKTSTISTPTPKTTPIPIPQYQKPNETIISTNQLSTNTFTGTLPIVPASPFIPSFGSTTLFPSHGGQSFATAPTTIPGRASFGGFSTITPTTLVPSNTRMSLSSMPPLLNQSAFGRASTIFGSTPFNTVPFQVQSNTGPKKTDVPGQLFKLGPRKSQSPDPPSVSLFSDEEEGDDDDDDEEEEDDPFEEKLNSSQDHSQKLADITSTTGQPLKPITDIKELAKVTMLIPVNVPGKLKPKSNAKLALSKTGVKEAIKTVIADKKENVFIRNYTAKEIEQFQLVYDLLVVENLKFVLATQIEFFGPESTKFGTSKWVDFNESEEELKRAVIYKLYESIQRENYGNKTVSNYMEENGVFVHNPSHKFLETIIRFKGDNTQYVKSDGLLLVLRFVIVFVLVKYRRLEVVNGKLRSVVVSNSLNNRASLDGFKTNNISTRTSIGAPTMAKPQPPKTLQQPPAPSSKPVLNPPTTSSEPEKQIAGKKVQPPPQLANPPKQVPKKRPAPNVLIPGSSSQPKTSDKKNQPSQDKKPIRGGSPDLIDELSENEEDEEEEAAVVKEDLKIMFGFDAANSIPTDRSKAVELGTTLKALDAPNKWVLISKAYPFLQLNQLHYLIFKKGSLIQLIFKTNKLQMAYIPLTPEIKKYWPFIKTNNGVASIDNVSEILDKKNGVELSVMVSFLFFVFSFGKNPRSPATIAKRIQ